MSRRVAEALRRGEISLDELKAKEWNTPVNTAGPEATAAKQAIRRDWNSPSRFSVKEQRWKPRMSTNQDEGMRLMAEAMVRYRARGGVGAPISTYKISATAVNALRARGWVDRRAPKLTPLGMAAVREFWPHYL